MGFQNSSRIVFGSGAFILDFPATGAHLVRLELRDKRGRLLSGNVYWHARDEHWLQQLNSAPEVALAAKISISHGANGASAEIKVSNPGKIPALAVHLTLRDKAGQRILPVYYDDNFFSLLPGESRTVHLETRTADKDLHVSADGWNVKSGDLD